jgi:fused signal recognition particle receptor
LEFFESMEQPQKKSFFDRFKRNNSETDTDKPSESIDQPNLGEKKTGQTFLGRMRKALSRTSSGFSSLFLGKKVIDAEILEELETLLLVADVGIEVTNSIIQELTELVKRNQLQDGAALHLALKKLLHAKLQPCEMSLNIDAENGPYVILVVGVNGVGKTTTIGKIANRLKQQGKSVLLAAGDTFRAAAVEQLQSWGERNQVSVVAQHTGADSASVIFDAIQAAKSRGIDVVIADTAGRLHNKSNLMEELEKVKRVAGKLDNEAPHEVLLVLDAGTGQNAVAQMSQFNQSVGVTGVALTKLDGTAKGGIIFALAEQFATPIRYIGVGEGQDDLQSFVAGDFIEALMGTEQSE